MDEDVGTVPELTAQLELILNHEANLRAANQLPSKEAKPADACPAPQLQRKTFKALGTPTVQADALCHAETDLSHEDILKAAEKRREELENAGEIDWVCDRQPYPTGQGPIPDQKLVGRLLEIRWRYTHKETGKPVYIWCEGEVVQV